MSVASLFTPCFVMFCVFLYGPFCHGAHKLDLSTLLTTFFFEHLFHLFYHHGFLKMLMSVVIVVFNLNKLIRNNLFSCLTIVTWLTLRAYYGFSSTGIRLEKIVCHMQALRVYRKTHFNKFFTKTIVRLTISFGLLSLLFLFSRFVTFCSKYSNVACFHAITSHTGFYLFSLLPIRNIICSLIPQTDFSTETKNTTSLLRKYYA